MADQNENKQFAKIKKLLVPTLNIWISGWSWNEMGSLVKSTDRVPLLPSLPWTLLRDGTMESSSDEEEVRTFIQVLSEKYSPENFPYGQGVVVMPSPPGSPVKGE